MSGLCVYGLIADADTLGTGILGTGIGGAAVRLLRAGALNALVSDIPPAPIARTRRSIAHAAVLERAVVHVDVLPLPCGSTTPHPAALAARIGAQADRLAAAFAGIAGRVQLTLKASWHEGIVSAEVIAADPELTCLRDRLQTLPATETSYERVELGLRVGAELAERRAAETAAMLAELSPLAEREVVLEPPEDDMIFNRAFLVPRARQAAFDAALRAVTSRHGDRVMFRHIGPMPPNHFVELPFDPLTEAA
ncbi:MAG TPA: GvpL/GvpF family gas vesicle protein [Rhodopila sp.]|nr:GvpL/GvpF family gas vesicle protein [Rhodopila sp.]